MNPELVVQRQLEAYNARDLEPFLAEYSEDVLAFRPPATEPSLAGKAAFGAFYAAERFNRPRLRAELLNRMVLCNTVIDHERNSGVREEPFDVAVVYKVVGSIIQCTWSFPAA